MDMMREYKQTEAGVIPEDWEVSTVGGEFAVQLGKMLDVEKNVGVPKPFLGNRAVQWGRIDLSDIGLIKLTPSDLQRYRLRDGDLLVCEGGEIGRAAIWRQQIEECYYQKALHRLRPKRGYNVVLMLNILQRLASTGFLQTFVTQTSIAHLPKDKFEGVPIPFPPTKGEQDAIADSLADADVLIGSLELLLAKKRQLKQGAMQELLTGRKRLPGFGKEWEEQSLGYFIDALEAGVSVNSIDEESGSYSHDAYILKTSAVESGRFLAHERKRIALRDVHRARLNPRSGTIIISRMNTPDLVGECGYVDVDQPLLFLPDRLWMTRFRSTRAINARWLSYLLSTTEYKRRIKAAATGTSGSMKNLSKTAFLSLEIKFPQIEEQNSIALILADMDAEIVSLDAKLAKVRSLKQGMMHELLTGRVRLV